jgi:hypothetical protein
MGNRIRGDGAEGTLLGDGQIVCGGAQMNVAPLHLVSEPHNIELEQALLGALLLANEPATNLPTFLEPRHFHEPLHQQIYEVVLRLTAAGKTANVLTVKPLLASDVTVGSLTLPQYLARLAAEAASIITADLLDGLRQRRGRLESRKRCRYPPTR